MAGLIPVLTGTWSGIPLSSHKHAWKMVLGKYLSEVAQKNTEDGPVTAERLEV